MLGDDEGLDTRLTRLLVRRRLTLSSEEEEAEEGSQPARPSAAAAALKQLLQNTAGELTNLQQDLGLPMGCWQSTPARASSRGGATAGDASAGAGAAPPRAGLNLRKSWQAGNSVIEASSYDMQQQQARQLVVQPEDTGQPQQQQQQQHIPVASMGPRDSNSSAKVSPNLQLLPQQQQEQQQQPAEVQRGPHSYLCKPLEQAQGQLTHLQQEERSREERLREERVQEELRRQAEEDARRRQARQQREQELLQIQLAYQQQQRSAGRIARAWKAYLQSPARARRVAAATRVQAAWRGLLARRTAALLRQRAQLLRQLHSAVEGGNRSGVQEAMAVLTKLGFASDAQQLVSAFEVAAEKAARQLQTATAAGSQMEFQSALSAAQRYGHLQQAAAEAVEAFAARVAAAEAALLAAVQGRPMLEFREAAAVAASLGVQAGTLQEAEKSIVARNQQAITQLLAAVEASPFNADALEAACQHADGLGLHAEVARAQRALQLRKHRIEQQLKALAEEASSGSEVEVAAADARLLGLAQAAEAALGRLAQRRAHMERELWRAAEKGTAEEYEIAAAQAAELGVAQAQQESSEQRFFRRRKVAEEDLARDAVDGSLAAFRRSRAAAMRLGLRKAVGEAEENAQRRRREAMGELEAAAKEACGFATHLDSCCEGSGDGSDGASSCTFAKAGHRGGAAPVLADHLNIARQLCDALAARAARAGGSGRCSPGRGRTSEGGGPAVEEALALAQHLCRFVPSAVHRHMCVRASKARSLQDVMLRFAAAAAEASRRELEKSVAAACAAVVGQFQALHLRRTATVLPLKCPKLHAEQPQAAQEGAQRGTAQEGAGGSPQSSGGDGRAGDIILQRVQCCALSGGPPVTWQESPCRSHEALLQGFQAWRRRQRESLSHTQLEALEAAWQPQLAAAAVVATEADSATSTRATSAKTTSARGTSARAKISRGDSRLWRLQLGDAMHLEVSRQGLTSLELLTGSTSLRSLDVCTNFLTSLQGLSSLASLQSLVVKDNHLACLGAAGELRGLSLLTRLVADENPLHEGASSALTGLADLPSLANLSLRSCKLPCIAGLQPCTALTSLSLANNCLADASPLFSLSRLIHLDVGGNRLASLEGLAARCPLLRSLVASGNPLGAFPADLSLPFLRKLWLNGCGLARVGAWPWLPSLRELHMQDNELSSLPPMYGFPSLASLDLSFNSLGRIGSPGNHQHSSSSRTYGGGLMVLLASLMPLRILRSLRLNDNPLAAVGGRALNAAVLEVLPWLEELNLEVVRPEQRAAQQSQALRRGRHRCLQGGGGEPPLCSSSSVLGSAVGQGEGQRDGSSGECCAAKWGAEAVLWALAHPDSAAAALQQQGVMVHAVLAAQGQPLQPGCSLEALEELAGLPGAGAGASPTNAGSGDARLVGRLLQQYAFLVVTDPAAQLRTLLDASPSYYRHTLAELARHATAIQARWRGYAARKLVRRQAEERHAARVHAAASLIQAVWRGRVVRRRYPDVAKHLEDWRVEWRRRQALLEAHRRHCAAMRVQATWRGHKVRKLVRAARAAAATQLRPLGAGPSLEDALDDDLASCDSFLAGILAPEGSHGGQDPLDLLGVEFPERLAPQLAAAYPRPDSSGSVGEDWKRTGSPLLAGTPGWAVLASPQPLNALSGGGGGTAVLPKLRPQEGEGSPVDVLAGSKTPARRSLAGAAAAGAAAGAVAAAGGWREESFRLPPLQQASPSAMQVAGASEPRAAGEQEAARGHTAGAEDPSGERELKDEATAAAYMQLRRKYAQQAKKRQARKHVEDPEARLKAFQRSSQLPEGPPLPSRAGSLHSAPASPSRLTGQLGARVGSAGSGHCSPRQTHPVGSPHVVPQPCSQSPAAGQSSCVAKGLGPRVRDGSPVQRRPLLLRTLFPFDF